MGKETLKERLASWIAWRLPRQIAYHATIRVWAHATMKNSNTHAPDITVDEALREWESNDR